MGLDHHRVSVAQWQSIRARITKVWGSIPHGASKVLIRPTLVKTRKNIFLYGLSIQQAFTNLYISVVTFTLQRAPVLFTAKTVTVILFTYLNCMYDNYIQSRANDVTQLCLGKVFQFSFGHFHAQRAQQQMTAEKGTNHLTPKIWLLILPSS